MQFASSRVFTKKSKEVILRMADISEASALIDAVVEIAKTL